MAGLIHDASLRRARDGSGGGVSGPKRMAGILLRLESGTLCQLLYDSRNIDTRQTACADFAMPRDGSE
jgi:hypothetical protein